MQVLSTGRLPFRLSRKRNVSVIQRVVALPGTQPRKHSLFFGKSFARAPFVFVEPRVLVECRKRFRIIHTVYLRPELEVLLVMRDNVHSFAENGWHRLFVSEPESIVLAGSMDCLLFEDIVDPLFGHKTPRFSDLGQRRHRPFFKGHRAC